MGRWLTIRQVCAAQRSHGVGHARRQRFRSACGQASGTEGQPAQKSPPRQSALAIG
jgi:hypothetical protein